MTRHKPVKSLCLILLMLLVTGCASMGNRLNRMELCMTKQDVRQLLGNGFSARAAKVDAGGNVLDLWEYTDQNTKQSYRIYFLNDKVSQWGQRDELESFPELHTPKYRN
jgi:hypothetical protein